MMKRIPGMSYEQLMVMPRDKLTIFFTDEYSIYLEEVKNSNNN